MRSKRLLLPLCLTISPRISVSIKSSIFCVSSGSINYTLRWRTILLKTRTLDRPVLSLFMTRTERGLIRGRCENGILCCVKGLLWSRIVWKWGKRKYLLMIGSFLHKTISPWKSIRRFIWLKLRLMIRKLTTLAK